MTPTERETGWPLSWTAPALGSLHPLQHLTQQLRSRRQIPLRIRDMGVSQIRGELRQMTLDIDAAPMPPGQRGNGQAMTQIVDARSARIASVAQTDLARQSDERPTHDVVPQAPALIREKEARAVRVRTQTVPPPRETLQHALRGRVHRDIARLTKLCVTDRQHAVHEIDVVTIETQRLASTQTGGGI